MKRMLVFMIFLVMTFSLFGQDMGLPRPSSKIGVDLLTAIENRSVARSFIKKSVSTENLATILWAGLGIRGADAVSSATKAGRNISFSGDTPYINVYVLTNTGAWKYIPEENKLQSRSSKDSRTEVSSGTIPSAALMVLFTVDMSLIPPFLRSNPGMFQQMAHANAGFAAQNMALTGSALKLSSLIQYSLNPKGAASVLKLSKDELPLFTLQMGYTE